MPVLIYIPIPSFIYLISSHLLTTSVETANSHFNMQNDISVLTYRYSIFILLYPKLVC